MNKANNTGEWQTVDKEAILVKNLVPDCFNTDFEAKEYLVHVWDEILNAMDEWQQLKQKLPQRVIEGL